MNYIVFQTFTGINMKILLQAVILGGPFIPTNIVVVEGSVNFGFWVRFQFLETGHTPLRYCF